MPNQQGGGFGFGGGGGGGDGSSLTVTNNGAVVEGRVIEIDFIGMEVTKLGNGIVQVESIGGGGGTGSPPYIAALNGKEITIPFSSHGKGSYASVRVFTASRVEVSVEFSQSLNRNITIRSNISLNGHVAVINNA
jgi:hypothetical protein